MTTPDPLRAALSNVVREFHALGAVKHGHRLGPVAECENRLCVESVAALAAPAPLDAAWAAVEAALPDGWRITRLDFDNAGPGTGWRAIASTDAWDISWNRRFCRATDLTPAAALLALAARLAKERDQG